jgi:rhodanese-related sulfurtransferase
VAEHFGDRSQPEPVDMRDLLQRVRSNEVIVLDARPVSEYEAGHIDGAISVPVDELQSRLRTLPSDKEYVAYCRGPYCVYADRAVELLLKSRRIGRRQILIAGWILAAPVPFLLMWAPTWSWVLVANALLGISQGLTWSTTVIMKIDLVGPQQRGLATG